MRLIIFDVDGTLTRSTSVDARCYTQAVVENLGVEVDTNWSAYRDATDAGIVGELLERDAFAETRDAVVAVRDRFLRLLSAAFDADPTCCREVPGAAALIRYLRGLPNLQPAIATGAWADSARLKLRQTGIDIHGIPFASSDDSSSREDILRIASERAAAKAAGVFDAVIYVGDAPWDASAARGLGFRFIGVACDGEENGLRSAAASVIFRDFTNRDAVIEQFLAG